MYRKPGDWQRTRHYLARRQAVLNWVQRSKLLEVLLAQSEGLRHTIRKPVMMQMYLQEPRGRHLQLPVEESGFADLLLWNIFISQRRSRFVVAGFCCLALACSSLAPAGGGPGGPRGTGLGWARSPRGSPGTLPLTSPFQLR